MSAFSPNFCHHRQGKRSADIVFQGKYTEFTTLSLLLTASKACTGFHGGCKTSVRNTGECMQLFTIRVLQWYSPRVISGSSDIDHPVATIYLHCFREDSLS